MNVPAYQQSGNPTARGKRRLATCTGSEVARKIAEVCVNFSSGILGI